MTDGTALGAAIISCSSLQHFCDFYGGELGFDLSPAETLSGEAFTRHWNLPSGATATAVAASVGDSPVGRVIGIAFDAPSHLRTTDGKAGPFIGYWNLNFYVDDIFATTDRLERQGYRFWSRPIRNVVKGGAGAPTEAIFAGPDDIAINLLQLDGEEGSQVAEIKRETAELPKSRMGFSQVATSAHATRDIAAASRFSREVLGMTVSIDAVLESPEVNELTGRPRDGRTQVLWMRGTHPLGKVALSEPLNYQLRDVAAIAVAPAIGQLAHSFDVPDLDRAVEAARECGAPPINDIDMIAIPGLGERRVAMVRSPGSNAFIQLVQA